jgi:hypothetical protein
VPALQLASLGPTATPAPAGATVCPGPDCNDNTVSPGVLGFGVFLALAVAVYFLVRSFRNQIRKVPASFDGRPEKPARPTLGPSVSPTVSPPDGPTVSQDQPDASA